MKACWFGGGCSISSVTMWILVFGCQTHAENIACSYCKDCRHWFYSSAPLGKFFRIYQICQCFCGAGVFFSSVGFFTAILEPLMLRTPFKPTEILLGLLVIAGICIIFHFRQPLQNRDYYWRDCRIAGRCFSYL